MTQRKNMKNKETKKLAGMAVSELLNKTIGLICFCTNSSKYSSCQEFWNDGQHLNSVVHYLECSI